MTEETIQKKIDSSLKTRVKSALIFAPVVLAVIYLGGIPFALLMIAAAGAGLYEWMRMVLNEKKHRAIFLLSGCAYISLSIGSMVWLRNDTTQGLHTMLMLLLVVWASDTFAYFTGKAIGGPKLAPKISPNKTWSGFIGSSVGAGIVAAAFWHPWVLSKFHIITIGDQSGTGYYYFAMGFVLGMFGQAGDLLKSVFKRRYGLKDTGTLIPGHGGILDRIDALLMVSLIFGMLAFLLKS
ncbi:MAG: phosphatidate cytidylyltransferase [Pseudomonadota bacterium]